MKELFEYIILVALCSASISYTISIAGIFEWLREWVDKKLSEKLSELIHCPYCLSHYVALTIMLTTKDIPLADISGNVIYDFLFTWFVIVAVTASLHRLIIDAYKTVAEMESFRKLRKRKEGK